MNNKKNKIIDISTKSYIEVLIMLGSLIVIAIALTFIVPKGKFIEITNPDGSLSLVYESLTNISGINIFKGLFSPILVLFSKDGLSLIMLSIFLLVITGSFQIMSDTNGMKIIVDRLIKRFDNRRKGLIAIIILMFMVFGSFFGLFEEMLTLFPIIIILSLSLGYDSFTAFLICIVATAFGFSAAITNPFTIITASELIGINPMTHVWYRIIIFIVMYVILLGYTLLHIKKIKKNPLSSPTYEIDLIKRSQNDNIDLEIDQEKNNKIFKTYVTFLIVILLIIMAVTSIEVLRSYTIVFLIVSFLIGGLIAGSIASEGFKNALNSFKKGVISAIPTILLVLMASSIKYVLEEGYILATIANSISSIIGGKSPFTVAILIYGIILLLEFFISSSTAKAIFVMGILSCVQLNISNELLVLIYLFGDGYTNVLFPTSPVLLISLSMIGLNYLSWIKKSKWLFLFHLIIVLLLIFIAVLIGY